MQLASLLALAVTVTMPTQEGQPDTGQLTIMKGGKPAQLCRLINTKVDADIAGLGARVTLVQTFANPSNAKVEAIYAFPLPSDAAVDRMRMKIGQRIIVGQIKKKAEAKAIYEQARAAGESASLLDQERPNLFTQSVANIPPGETIEVEISYVVTLKFEKGEIEFSYPMTVGERYITGDTPDVGKVTGPVTRPGDNIELIAHIDAGTPIVEMRSTTHELVAQRSGTNGALVRLARSSQYPNKDFVLKYKVAEDAMANALLTYSDPKKGGFFTIILAPPKAPRTEDVSPREVVFVMDQSGSQQGFPIEKSKELTAKMIETLGPNDTFNVISFSSGVNRLWPSVNPVTPHYRQEALDYVGKLEANGGTEFGPAVLAALEGGNEHRNVRLVVFNTDGKVTNDFEVLKSIKGNRGGARMFTFGIGSDVNRFLVEQMSREGKGACEIVTEASQADPAVARFVERTRYPLLTRVSVSFEGVKISDVYPKEIPDVFSASPVIIKGRFSGASSGKIKISGLMGGKPWSQVLPLRFEGSGNAGSAIASLWAREKISDLMSMGWGDMGPNGGKSGAAAEITKVALDFGLVSQFTSFVATEGKMIRRGEAEVFQPAKMADVDSLAFDPNDNSIVVMDAANRPGITVDGRPRATGATRGGRGAMGGVPASVFGADLSKAKVVGGKFPDSPENHAAYEALAKMKKSGMLVGYPDGLFRGNRPASAHEIASSVHSTYAHVKGNIEALEKMFMEIEAKYAPLKAAEKRHLAQLTSAQRKDWLWDTRVVDSLKSAKGDIDVFVWLDSWDSKTIKKLERLGLKVGRRMPKLFLLIGKLPAAQLQDMAVVPGIRLIAPPGP